MQTQVHKGWNEDGFVGRSRFGRFVAGSERNLQFREGIILFDRFALQALFATFRMPATQSYRYKKEATRLPVSVGKQE
jgi:hypothetical protein